MPQDARLTLALVAVLVPLGGCIPAMALAPEQSISAGQGQPGSPRVGAEPARRPVGTGAVLPPTAVPATDLARMRAYRDVLRLAAAQHETIWPGFRPTAYPLVVNAGRVAFMFHNPLPVAPFAAAEGLEGVAVADSTEGLPRGLSLSHPVGDRRVAVIPDGQEDQALLTAYHELFHVYQRDQPFYLGRSSDLTARSARDLGLAEVEQRLLAQALASPDDAAARLALRRFLAVRGERQADASADFVANEDGLEAIEGTARYVEAHMQILAGEAPGLKPSPAFMDRPGIEQHLMDRLSAPLSAEDFRRQRYMWTGAVMGLILDRLGAPWKRGAEEGQRMVALVASAADYDPAAQARLLAEADAEWGFARRIAEAEARLASAAGAQEAAIAAFDSERGPLVTLLVPFSYGGFGLASYESFAIARGTELYGPGTALSLAHDALSVQVEGRLRIRLLETRNAFEFHAKGATWTLDGRPLPESGTAEGALTLSGDGLQLRAARARVTVEPGRIRVALPPYSESE